MLALAPQTRNKFKAGFRPGRLREMKSKHVIGRAASSPGNEFMQSAGAIAWNEIKACNRLGRLPPPKLLCLCGRGDYEKWIQSRLAAGAEAKADWSTNDRQIKNTIPFLLLFKLTPLFGNALIRYFDLTFTYKKTGCLAKKTTCFSYQSGKII